MVTEQNDWRNNSCFSKDLPRRDISGHSFLFIISAKILQDWRQRTQHCLSYVMILPILYYVTARPSFPISPVLYFCAVPFQQPVTAFPGVIVKVFGSINPMWSWEWLKRHEFDSRLNIPSLTFQCWAPKRDCEEKQAPHPFQPGTEALISFFQSVKVTIQNHLELKARWDIRDSPTLTLLPGSLKILSSYRRVSWQTPRFVISPDFNSPRVVCTLYSI